jgi:hypothetical protein
VETLTLDSRQESRDVWVEQMMVIARQTLEKAQGLSAKEAYLRLKTFLQEHADDEALVQQTARYFEELREAGLTHEGVATRRTHAWQMLLLWPFFLVGYAFWFLPCYLPLLLCKKMNIYPGYDSNIKMLAGLITFSLALWGGWELAFVLSGQSWMAWLSLPLWAALGYVAEYFMDRWRLWQEVRKARRYEREHGEFSKEWKRFSNFIL